MRTKQNRLYKGVAVFFIGLIAFITLHIYAEYHLDSSPHQNHHCVLCHQTLIAPTPIVLILIPIGCLWKKVLSKMLNVYIRKVTFEHLSVRGPPISNLDKLYT